MMSSNTMRTATENANMTGSMSGAAAEKHMPDATGPGQTANAEASGRPASSRRASSMYRRAKLTVFGSLKAELLKLWSLNSTKVLLGIAVALMLAMSALSAWSVTFMASTDLNTGKTLDNPKPISAADMWAVLASSGSTAALVIGIFGVMAITSEYTTSAVQSSLTVNPRRGMFYATKSVATALFALVAGIVGILLAAGVLWLFTRGHDITALTSDQSRIIPVTLIGFPLTIVLVSLMAQGLGGMTRSTVGGVCALIVLFMVLSSVLSITSMAINQVEWLGTLSYLTPDTAMNHFLGAGIESSSQSTLAAAVKPNYWIPDWWQSGLILLAWAAAAWAGGLIVTKKADIK